MVDNADPTALTHALAAIRSAAPSPSSSSSGGGAASTVAVSNLPACQQVTAAALPLPAGAAQDGTDATGVTGPTGGVGIRGWLSGIFSRLPSAFGANGGLKVDAAGTALPVALSGITNVSVSNFPATQPVSLATNTPDITDRAPRLLGHVTVDTMPTTTVTGSVALSQSTTPAAANPAATWRQFATGAAAAAGTVTQAAAGAGVKNYLAGFTFSYTGAALTAGTTVQVKDGATVIYEEYVPQSTATAGSVFRPFATPLAGTANTALTVNASAGVTSVTQKVAAWGYTGP